VQVSGRAGRAELPGRVIVQTLAPQHPVLQEALRGDYEGFLQRELAERALVGWPPTRRLVQMTVEGRSEEAVYTAATALGEALRAQGLQVMGPAAAALYQLRGQFRRQLVVFGGAPTLQNAVRAALAHSGLEKRRDLKVHMDRDPQGGV